MKVRDLHAIARPEGRKISLRSASLRCVLRGGYSRDSTEIGRPAEYGVESQQHTESIEKGIGECSSCFLQPKVPADPAN